MKTVFVPALLCAALFLTAAPAMATSNICINTKQISSEKVEGRGVSILYKMRDGTQWRNTLQSPCPDLVYNGYIWVLRNPDQSVCENEQSMRVIDFGDICMLGKFEKVAPVPKG